MSDLVVLGATPAQLTVALECASVGLSVTVVRDASQPVFAGAKADAQGLLADLIETVEKPLRETEPVTHVAKVRQPRKAFVRAQNKWKPLPADAVWGIPTSPLDKKVIDLLGFGGATRAYADRIKPVLTIGATEDITKLVQTRIGKKALEIMVDPLLANAYGCDTAEVDVATAMPGFNQTLTRVGSITGAALAYSERYETLQTRIEPEGGWQALTERLLAKLVFYGAQIIEVDEIAALSADWQESEWVVTGADLELRSRSLVVTKGRTDGLKRPCAELAVEAPAELQGEAHAEAFTAWKDSSNHNWAASIKVDGATATANIWGETALHPNEITKADIAEALQKLGVKAQPATETIFATLDAEPWSEEMLKAIANDFAQTPENMLVECLLDTSDSGLERSIGLVKGRSVWLRRQLLGLSA